MKPGKLRLKRRAQQERLAKAGQRLKNAAANFISWQHSVNDTARIDSKGNARQNLYEAAIAFSAEVDGEEQPSPLSVALRAAK